MDMASKSCTGLILFIRLSSGYPQMEPGDTPPSRFFQYSPGGFAVSDLDTANRRYGISRVWWRYNTTAPISCVEQRLPQRRTTYFFPEDVFLLGVGPP
jgi:hypothetical protein